MIAAQLDLSKPLIKTALMYAFGTEVGSNIGNRLRASRAAEVTVDNFVDGQILQAQKGSTEFHKSAVSL